MYPIIPVCAFLIWNIKVSFQMDFIVLKDDNLVKPNIIKRNTVALPKIKEFIVKTSVANRFAETSILSRVENADRYPKQTAFSAVLPKRAFISGFSMEIGGVTYTAFVKGNEEAKKIYNQSVTSGQTAAHVAVSTRNSNRFTVYVNVEPVSIVNFRLTYEELLQRERGQYEIIANIQPGQIVEKLEVEVTIKENSRLLFVRTPSLRSGNIAVENNTQLDPEAVIKISKKAAVVKFHANVYRQLKFACAGLGNKEYEGFAGQFIVQYDIERDPNGGETLFQNGFFVNFFAPPNLKPIPKHVVFVLDTSGSMRATKIAELRHAMFQILPQLNSEDLFNIVQFHTDVHVWDLNLNSVNVIPKMPNYGFLSKHLQTQRIPNAMKVTQENIDSAKTIVNKFLAFGGTNSMGGLEVGLYLIKRVQEAHKKVYQPIMIFLTDGLPRVGITDTSRIVTLIKGINSKEYNTPIYSLGIGSDLDWTFLRQLSISSKAESIRIYNDNVGTPDVSKQLQDFYKNIGNPVLSNVAIKNLPTSSHVSQVEFPVFLDGSEITIVGKVISGISNIKPITISARGRQGPVDLESKIGIPLTRLERIWAHVIVKSLLDKSVATNSDKEKTELQTQAHDIALQYSMVTQLTSLVIVKPEDATIAPKMVDASFGIFPQTPNELPSCKNLEEWIQTHLPTTTTTTVAPTTTKLTTTSTKTTTRTTTTVKPTTTTKSTTTSKPTTTTRTTTTTRLTTEKIKTCQDMQFGCCYDGVTAAEGINYAGCDPIPRSESCSLPINNGACPSATRYALKWSYNNDNGECVPLIYIGCGGNDNRFSSKEVCQKTCVSPTGPEPTTTAVPKTTTRTTTTAKPTTTISTTTTTRPTTTTRTTTTTKPTITTRTTTTAKSTAATSTITSTRPTTKASTTTTTRPTTTTRTTTTTRPTNTTRTTTTTKPTTTTRTTTKPTAATSITTSTRLTTTTRTTTTTKSTTTTRSTTTTKPKTSGIKPPEVCFLPQYKGTCERNETKYYYDNQNGLCKLLYYGGCNGNENIFDYRYECEKSCIKRDDEGFCYLPAVKGRCKQSHKRWFFNKATQTCAEFVYGGCNGNKNNFITREDCHKNCVKGSSINI